MNSDDDKVNVFALVNGVPANFLIDTGAERNHIDKGFINRTNLSVNNSAKEEIGLAVKGSTVKTRGSCNVQTDLLDRSYDKVNMLVMDNLMWDVILGREFLRTKKCYLRVWWSQVSFEFFGCIKGCYASSAFRVFNAWLHTCRLQVTKLLSVGSSVRCHADSTHALWRHNRTKHVSVESASCRSQQQQSWETLVYWP